MASHGHLEPISDNMFTVIKDFGRALCPRLGRLRTGKASILTPHYLAITSRGVVPHLSQDTFARDANISGVYVPLEDCESPAIHDSRHHHHPGSHVTSH